MGLDYSFMNAQNRKRTIKQPPIPNDYTTIVSICPKEFHFVQATCQPSEFRLEKGSKANPFILVIGSSSWWQNPGFEQPFIEIQVPSITVANSLVNDNIGAMLSSKLGVAQPGVFHIAGKHEVKDIDKVLIEKYEIYQKNWYRELIKLADVDWARTNGNPLSISDDARLAAQELGQKDKPWMGDFRTFEMIPCVACGGLRNPQFPICPNCHNIIDQPLFDKLNLKKAVAV